MCPFCLATIGLIVAGAAAMAAGAGSTGGILAVCIGKFRKFFKANGFSLLQKNKEKLRWQHATREMLNNGKEIWQ